MIGVSPAASTPDPPRCGYEVSQGPRSARLRATMSEELRQIKSAGGEISSRRSRRQAGGEAARRAFGRGAGRGGAKARPGRRRRSGGRGDRQRCRVRPTREGRGARKGPGERPGGRGAVFERRGEAFCGRPAEGGRATSRGGRWRHVRRSRWREAASRGARFQERAIARVSVARSRTRVGSPRSRNPLRPLRSLPGAARRASPRRASLKCARDCACVWRSARQRRARARLSSRSGVDIAPGSAAPRWGSLSREWRAASRRASAAASCGAFGGESMQRASRRAHAALGDVSAANRRTARLHRRRRRSARAAAAPSWRCVGVGVSR